jgi:hypothetical protein
MARAKKMVDVNIHGAVGSGPTKAAATAHAAWRIQQAFEDGYGYVPEVWTFPHDEQMVLFRTLIGWNYGCILTGKERQTLCGSGNYATKPAAIEAMLRHVAQGYWDDEASQYGMDILMVSDLEGRKRQQGYRMFQRAYRFYHDQMGYDDPTCHRLACDAEARGMILVTAH